MGKGYAQKLWDDCQRDYESGFDYSIAELSRMHPPLKQSAIRRHAKLHGWQRGRLAGQVKMERDKKTVEKFADLGLPEEDVLRRVIEGIKTGDEAVNAVKSMLERAAEEPGGAEEKLMSPGVQRIVRDMFNDMNVRFKYIQEYNRMVGGYAPLKRDVTAHGEGVNVPILIFPDNRRADN